MTPASLTEWAFAGLFAAMALFGIGVMLATCIGCAVDWAREEREKWRQ